MASVRVWQGVRYSDMVRAVLPRRWPKITLPERRAPGAPARQHAALARRVAALTLAGIPKGRPESRGHAVALAERTVHPR
jgi:hypothetical protein